MRVQNIGFNLSGNFANDEKSVPIATNISNTTRQSDNKGSISFGMAKKAEIVAFSGSSDNSLNTPQNALKIFDKLGVKAEIKKNSDGEDKIVLLNGYKTNTEKLKELNIDENQLFKHVKEVRGRFEPLNLRNLDLDYVGELQVDPESNIETVKVSNAYHVYLHGDKLKSFESSGNISGIFFADSISGIEKIKFNNAYDVMLKNNNLKSFESTGNIKGTLLIFSCAGLEKIKVNNCENAFIKANKSNLLECSGKINYFQTM